MAARFPAAEDPLVPPPPSSHEWELLSMSTISSSTLLSGNHGLSFGLPPLSSTHILPHTSSNEKGEAERGFAFGGGDGISLPLDVSQIAVMCSSTSSVEPFTEGWKPQFRIAGADLQENYYTPDPFATSAASNTGSSVEPFPNMEHSFVKEPSMAVGKGGLKSQGKHGFFAADDASKTGTRAKSGEYLNLSGDYDPMLLACEKLKKKANQEASEVSDATRKAENRKGLDVQGKCTRQNRHGKLNRRSYLTWSVALTTTLFGVLLISYCFQRDTRELPTRDKGTGMT